MVNSKLYHIYPTMKCNLSCSHCFLHQEIRDQTKSMTDEEFRQIIDELATDFNDDTLAEFAEVTIIGGEPTLMKPDFYIKNIPYLKEKFTKKGKRISLTIVTNFTNINTLKRYSNLFDIVSTSYEWDRFDNQENLLNKKSKKNKWWENLRKWTGEGRNIAISLATTHETIANWEVLFNKLYSEGVRLFQVNLLHPDGELMKNILSKEDYDHFDANRQHILTTPLIKHNFLYKPVNYDIWSSFEEESNFLINLSKWVEQKKDQSLIVYPINSHIESLKTGVANTDIACPASEAFCVTTTGNVTGCTIESGKIDMISYGNIYKTKFSDIKNSELRINHITSLDSKPVRCLGCDFFYFCKGGCSFRELFWDSEDINRECHGLKNYFLYLKYKIEH